ncbi:MAG: hypothetical protein NUW24_16705 [Anaerolineae bacterium]|jgi:hypothetical protein|nr:hypothetical protein [Anaerolineae bacterium]MDH7474378.1 hypothetical protein [Anaerolineae bacterium]
MAESYQAPETPAPKKSNIALIIIVVAVVLVLLCCCILAIIITILRLLGPEIGNVFSGIIESIELTPVP